MTREAKYRAIVAAEGARVVVHFAETRRALQALAREQGRSLDVTLSDGLAAAGAAPAPNATLRVLVAERHPLREHDERVASWADSSAASIVFHVSLDDAVLSLFVTDSLRAILDKLGATPDAPLESGMVSRSIEKAQGKIKKKARGDLPADSPAAWMQANLPSDPG